MNKGFNQGLDRQAQRTATLTLASCVLLLLLPTVSVFERKSPIRTDTYLNVRSCWFSPIGIRRMMHRIFYF